MLKLRCFLLLACLEMCLSQTTNREPRVLSRKRRYLAFPEGSNFIITMSFVKALMKDVPKGINVLGECDVPFKLPSDARLFRKHHRVHYRQRRDVYSQLASALSGNGIDGNACVKRMLCEMQTFVNSNKKSLVRDILSAIFKFPEVNEHDDHSFQDFCHHSTFTNCTIPILKFILGSFLY